MSQKDFQLVVDYMIEMEYAYNISENRIYVLAKSLNEISNDLVAWAEKEGIVDQSEYSLIDELYETTSTKGFSDDFAQAPREIKDMIMHYTQS